MPIDVYFMRIYIYSLFDVIYLALMPMVCSLLNIRSTMWAKNQVILPCAVDTEK